MKCQAPSIASVGRPRDCAREGTAAATRATAHASRTLPDAFFIARLRSSRPHPAPSSSLLPGRLTPLEREDALPVRLHVDDRPALGCSPRRGPCRAGRRRSRGRRPTRARRRCGGRRGRAAGRRRRRSTAASAGRRRSCRRPRSAGGRCAAVDADRLARAVVDEVDLGQLHAAPASPSRISNRVLPLAADDLLGRNAVDPFGPRPHELDAAAGDDERLEAVRAQVGQQLEHRLVDHLGVEPLDARMLRGADPVADDLRRTRRWSCRRGWPS